MVARKQQNQTPSGRMRPLGISSVPIPQQAVHFSNSHPLQHTTHIISVAQAVFPADARARHHSYKMLCPVRKWSSPNGLFLAGTLSSKHPRQSTIPTIAQRHPVSLLSQSTPSHPYCSLVAVPLCCGCFLASNMTPLPWCPFNCSGARVSDK